MTCTFCQILSGELPGSFVYRDATIAAFMDIQPINPGHVLVVPVRHAVYLADLHPEEGAQIFRLAQRLSTAMFRIDVRCEGTNLFLANGAPAGQEVFHVHLHVLPRYHGDHFGFRFGPGYGARPAREILDAQALQLKSATRKPNKGS